VPKIDEKPVLKPDTVAVPLCRPMAPIHSSFALTVGVVVVPVLAAVPVPLALAVLSSGVGNRSPVYSTIPAATRLEDRFMVATLPDGAAPTVPYQISVVKPLALADLTAEVQVTPLKPVMLDTTLAALRVVITAMRVLLAVGTLVRVTFRVLTLPPEAAKPWFTGAAIAA